MTEKIIHVVNRFSARCKHNKFIVDNQLGYVKCGLCGEHLNPIWVIEQYANHEHRLFQHLERLERLIELTKEKTKCKCEHCGEITKIANKNEINKAF